MKKITKVVSTLGLGIVLMGGLFVTNVSAATQKPESTTIVTTRVMAVDPPAH